jgi:hypothetical protein
MWAVLSRGNCFANRSPDFNHILNGEFNTADEIASNLYDMEKRKCEKKTKLVRKLAYSWDKKGHYKTLWTECRVSKYQA